MLITQKNNEGLSKAVPCSAAAPAVRYSPRSSGCRSHQAAIQQY